MSLPILIAVALVAQADKPIERPTSLADGNTLVSLFSEEDYPLSALRNNEQGTVEFVILVTAEGAVGDCTIRKSSGSAVLDQRTCDVMRERARFTPAKDDKGHPVESRYAQRVTWRLPQQEDMAGGNRLTDFRRTLRIDIDQAGKVTDCRDSIQDLIGEAATKGAGCAHYQEMASSFLELSKDKGQPGPTGYLFEKYIDFDPIDLVIEEPKNAVVIFDKAAGFELDKSSMGYVRCQVIATADADVGPDPCGERPLITLGFGRTLADDASRTGSIRMRVWAFVKPQAK